MALSMLSLGILNERASSMAKRRRTLEVGSGPPSLAATVIFLPNLVKICPRLASSLAFLCLMLAHLEWPAIVSLPFLPYCSTATHPRQELPLGRQSDRPADGCKEQVLQAGNEQDHDGGRHRLGYEQEIVKAV